MWIAAVSIGLPRPSLADPYPVTVTAGLVARVQPALDADPATSLPQWRELRDYCETEKRTFEDYATFGDGMTFDQYAEQGGQFHGWCGRAFFHVHEFKGGAEDLALAINSLRKAESIVRNPEWTYLLGRALEDSALHGLSAPHQRWADEIDGLWMTWKAIDRLDAIGRRRFLINASWAAGDTAKAVSMSRQLVSRLMDSLERNAQLPDHVAELTPLVRMLADRYRYVRTDGVAAARGTGRGLDATTLDDRFQFSNIAPDIPPEEQEFLRLYYEGLGADMRNLLWATYFNDENPAAGVHRLLGMEFARLNGEALDAGDQARAEQLFDQARSSFVAARELVGWGFVRDNEDGGEPAAEAAAGGDAAEPTGVATISPPNSDAWADRLAKAELLMRQAELEGYYGDRAGGFGGDERRKIPMTAAAFSDIRTATSLVSDFPDITAAIRDRPEGCVELDPTTELVLKIRSYYGLLLKELIVALDTRDLPKNTAAMRISQLQPYLDVPFFYHDKPEQLIYTALQLKALGRVDSALDLARRGFELLVERSHEPFATWIKFEDERDSLGDRQCEHWKIRPSASEDAGYARTGMLGLKCDVITWYLSLLKQANQHDEVASISDALNKPELAQTDARYEHFNWTTCEAGEFAPPAASP